MKYFTTLSDKNYKLQGFTLFKSLLDTSSEEFVLYYLCMDDETYNDILNINKYHNNIIGIKLSDLESKFEDLQATKSNMRYDEYCWACASWFSNYLIKNYEIDHITYIDTDILFLKDPQIIYDVIGDKSVGIHEHKNLTEKSPYGKYNVGVVYFKSNEIGLKVLDWWSDAVMNKKYPEFATCGDQKYLEGFVPRFGEENICIFDSGVGHGAPWNWRLFVYEYFNDDGTVVWGNIRQPLVFVHFSQFGFNLDTGEIDHVKGKYPDHTLNQQVFNIPEVKQIYIDYFNKIKEVRSMWL